MKKIFLDVDEEITSVIDKLKGSSDKEVSLVVPKDSPLLQSVVNLKLIKREAEKEGMSVVLMTSNKVGRTLAENIGLKAISAAGEKKEPAEILAQTKEKIDIAYKETDDGIEEEVVFDRASLDENEIKIKEENDDKPIEMIDEDQPDEKVEKSVVPVDKKAEKPKNFFSKIFSPFAVFVFLTLIGFLVFGYIYIPRTTVTIEVASEKKNVEADIIVDKNQSDKTEATIKGETVELKKEYKKNYQATGTKNVGTKATGSLTISNKYDSNPQTLVAGTRFSANNLIFKLTQQVEVPGAKVSGGSLQAGTIKATVEAEIAGDQYNINPSHFIISAFVGTPKDGLIYGDSSTAMTGGLTKEVKVVTNNDFTKAKADFTSEVTDGVKKELQSKIQEGKVLPDEAIDAGIGTISSSPDVGGEGDDFTLTANVNAQGLVYSSNELKTLFNQKIKDEFGSSKQVVDDGYDAKKLTISKFDLKNGSMNINIATEAFYGSVIDKNKVKTEIMGQTEQKSLDYLKTLENVKNARIEFWPQFLKRVPRIEKHVIVNTEAFKE